MGDFMKTLVSCAAALAFTCIAMPVLATETATTALINEAVGVPVFPNDITDRPYRVLGEVKAGVRKATVLAESHHRQKSIANFGNAAGSLVPTL
jgi:hypothetical protein